MTGVCKFWKKKEGYGFLIGDDGINYFVHYRNIQGSSETKKNLVKGKRYGFIASKGDRGMVASKVRGLRNAATSHRPNAKLFSHEKIKDILS